MKIKDLSRISEIKNISKQIVIYLSIAIILFGVGYLAWLNHNDFEKAMVNQAKQQLMLIAKSEAQSIQSYINDIHDELDIASSQPIVHEVLKKEPTVLDQNVARMLSETYKDVGRFVDSLYLINSKGILVNTGNPSEGIFGKDLSNFPDVKEVFQTKKAYTSAIFKMNSGARVIAHTHPVMEGDKLIGLLRVLILVDRVNEIASHINQAGLSAVIIDGKAAILSFPQAEYLGKDISKVLADKYPASDFSEFKKVLTKIEKGEEGDAVARFIYPENISIPKITIMSFCPIFVNGDIWSIIVSMPYEKIAGPINNNLRDNIVFVGFIIAIFIIIARILYGIHKKKDKLEIEKIALDIINRELHADIRERKRIEEEVQKELGNKNKRG